MTWYDVAEVKKGACPTCNAEKEGVVFKPYGMKHGLFLILNQPAFLCDEHFQQFLDEGKHEVETSVVRKWIKPLPPKRARRRPRRPCATCPSPSRRRGRTVTCASHVDPDPVDVRRFHLPAGPARTTPTAPPPSSSSRRRRSEPGFRLEGQPATPRT